jgi:hypothetical protein
MLVSWLSQLAAEFLNKCSRADAHEAKLVDACLWGLASYFHLLKHGGRFFTDEEVSQFDAAGHTCLFMYFELAKRATDPGLWHFVPKHHQMHHLMLDALEDRANPNFWTCFGDEDNVGRMLRLPRRGHSSTMISHALDMYVIGCKQRFQAVS